jgi:chemotaxis receptor (MCP) glutamine deamidase CheD
VPQPPARRLVRIEAGGVHAARQPTDIRTVLGSCVAACVYDPATGIGGMNHFMLPSGESGERPARYGVHAMELLINDIMKLGGERSRLRAKVFGGAAVLRGLKAGVDVGRRNAEFIRTFLATERIPIDAEQLGGAHPLEVRFATDTGKARVRALEAGDDVLLEEQRVTRPVPAPAPRTTDTDLDDVLF